MFKLTTISSIDDYFKANKVIFMHPCITIMDGLFPILDYSDGIVDYWLLFVLFIVIL